MSKTMIVSFISILSGLLMAAGVDFPEETKAQIVAHLEAVLGGVVVLYGIAMAILRKLTDSPLVGWLTKAKR